MAVALSAQRTRAFPGDARRRVAGPRLGPAGAETARAGRLPSVTARGLAAGAAVWPQLVLEGVPLCLEGEEEGRQPLSHGSHGFFALHVGGMNIVWGRQAS